MKPNATEIRQQLGRYRGFLTHDPGNTGIIAQVADLHLQLGELTEARRLLDDALIQTPGDVMLRARLATVAMASGAVEEAVGLYAQLLSEGHDNPVLRYNFGYALMLARRFSEANEVLAQIPDNTPDAPDAPLLRARALHHLGDLETAITYSERYLQIHPASSDGAGVLAMLNLDAENATEAKKWAALATSADPDNLEGLVTLGALALVEQDIDRAAEYHTRAVSKHPRSGRAWVGMGLSSMRGLDLKSAVGQLERAVKYMPNHIGTWHALAWCQLMLNQVDAAELSFQESMALDRNFAETHGGLAVIAVARGRYDEADGMIKRALRLNPQSFAGRFAQSLLLKHRGNPDASQAVMQDILQSPVLPDGSDLKSMLLSMQNETRPVRK